MAKLLMVDLKRIIKDKLFLVVCIIGVAFALGTPLLYKALFSSIQLEGDELFSSLFTVKSMFFQCFSLTNNFGLIVPILIIIIIFKDFSFGTIRNKIISGNSRIKIFLSLFLSSSVVIVSIMLLYATISGLFSLALFPNNVGKVTLESLNYFALSVLFEILVLLYVAALISFVNVFSKNVGIAIIFYVAVALLATAFSGVVTIGIELLSFQEGNELLVKFLTALLKSNIFYSCVSIIGVNDKYLTEDIIYILLSTILYTGLLILLAILKFKKKDIK